METATKNISLKELIADWSFKRQYLSVDGTRRWLREAGHSYKSISVKQELHNLKEMGLIYNSGRGWYSTLPELYQLDTSVVEEQEKQITEAFPLISFSIWSNRQLLNHYHHLPTRYVALVYLEFDAMGPVRDYLLGEDIPVYMNPHAPEIEKNFFIDKNPSVLRPMITEGPADGHFATVEKILVDLFIEKDKLYLMDAWEYREIFFSITERYRINIGGLLRYAQRRKVRPALEKLVKPLTQVKG